MSAAAPLRVVTLVNRIGKRGGAERLAVELAAGLARRGLDSTLCVSRRPPEHELDEAQRRQERQVLEAGGRVLGLSRRSKADLVSWRPLVAHMQQESTHVLHAHMVASNAWATLLGALTGVPVVVSHEHTWSYEGRPLRRLVDRHLIARGSDALVAVSEEDRRRMIEIERIDPADIVVVPNGVPAPAQPSGRDVRSQLGLAPRAPFVVAFGRLDRQKGFDVLIEAVAMTPEVSVVIAGEGSERGPLEELARALGVQDRVLLPGYRADMPDLLAEAHAAIFSSRYEGSPLSLIESMAAGAPIVATSVGGVPDLVEDGVHALLVPPDDPSALARALAGLMADERLRFELGSAARARQRSEFTLEAMVDRLCALYETLWQRAQAHAERPLPPLSPANRLRRLAGR